MKISKSRLAIIGSGAIALIFTVLAVAQNPGLKRTVVMKADVLTSGREAVVARVEIAPGGASGWHTHPGDEISYIMEGEGELMIAGQPGVRPRPVRPS